MILSLAKNRSSPIRLDGVAVAAVPNGAMLGASIAF
jgi:hypothetical protein